MLPSWVKLPSGNTLPCEWLKLPNGEYHIHVFGGPEARELQDHTVISLWVGRDEHHIRICDVIAHEGSTTAYGRLLSVMPQKINAEIEEPRRSDGMRHGAVQWFKSVMRQTQTSGRR